MLKLRLITAAFLLPIVICGILFAPPQLFAVLSGVIVLCCIDEWRILLGVKNQIVTWIFFIVTLLMMIAQYFYFIESEILFAFTLFIPIFIAILTYPRSLSWWGHPQVVGILGLVLLPAFFISLVKVHADTSPVTLLILMILVWCADTGAYILGRWKGKHKLCPAVSPGKTWEGLTGGFLLTFAAGFACFVAGWVSMSLTLWLAFLVMVFVLSVVGDLFISLLKRRVNVKDTGNRLPGHGGILDRLDSLIPVTLFAYVFSNWVSSFSLG